MLNDNFVEIDGFNGNYLIGSTGEIRNRTKKLKTFTIHNGYKAIILTAGGIRKHFLIHRLVAMAFIPNSAGKNEVNHIDGNKLNNNVCNLEWVSSSENKHHAFRTGLRVRDNFLVGFKRSTESKYHNVSWDNSRSKWIGAVRDKGVTHGQKRFNTEEEAALHVNSILDKLNLSDRPRNIII